MEFIDLEYIQEKILQYEKKPSTLKKFFNGEIVDEIVDLLIKQDKQEDQEKEHSIEYQKIEKCFNILKKEIIEENLPRLFPILSNLFKCKNFIWKDALDDIERFQNKTPKECVNDLLKTLLKEIPSFKGLKIKVRILKLVNQISSKHKIEKPELFNPLKDILNSLFAVDEKESFDYGKDFLIKFENKMLKETKIEIWDNLINIMDPLSKIDKSKWIIELCINNSDKLESQNKENLLLKINSQIYDISVISNEDASNFWLDNSKLILDWYMEPQLDLLIKDQGDEANILRLPETRLDISAKKKIAKIITMIFDKISTIKQQVYLSILHQYLQDGTKDNYQFAINNIYEIKEILKNIEIIKPLLPDLATKLDVELDSKERMENINIQFSFKDFIDQQQKDKVINNVINLFPTQDEFCYNFINTNWIKLSNLHKIKSIKSMLKTKIKEDFTKKTEIILKISNDYEKLGDEEKMNLLDEHVTKISNDIDNINFFKALISKAKKYFTTKLRDAIRNKYIEIIKKEEKLNISRNRFSVICSFKTKDFFKDNEVFSLFSNLLSSSTDKIKLAIDFLIPYYKNKPPYRKKAMLVNLLEDANKKVDQSYKKKIHQISKKLGLRMKKSIIRFLRIKKA